MSPTNTKYPQELSGALAVRKLGIGRHACLGRNEKGVHRQHSSKSS